MNSMAYKNYLLLFWLVFSVSSCFVNEEKYTEIVLCNLRKDNIDIELYTHIVIIPNVGCGGCISEAEHFFQENKEENILFVFTKVRSLKELRLRHGKKLERKNVLVDKQQRYASEKEEINIYPIIIDIRGKGRCKWDFLEPGVSYQDILKNKVIEK